MSNILHDYVNNSHHKSSVSLLKLRIWLQSSFYIYMVAIAFILLRIDFTTAEDPAVRVYQNNRWLLITSWFNLISLAYIPVCIYCDWRELQRTDDVKHVKLLNKIRFICFSAILFPATMFSDILFWKLWMHNRELVAPPAVDVLVPMWLQHSLHTFSLGVIISDLLLVPRRRPKDLMFGACVLGAFFTAYGLVCARSIIDEEYLYPILKAFRGYNFIALAIFVVVEQYLYFTTQWFIIEFLWGPKTKLHKFFSTVSLPAGMKKDISEAKRIN